MGGPGWTYERTMQLVELWQDGCSAGQISRIIPQCTRSMVVAKVNRLRCSSHPMLRGENKGTRQRVRIARPAVTLEPDAPPPVEPAVFKLDGKPVTLETIRGSMCHYPIGDPQAKDFCYCGNPGRPYCDWHRSIMFQPKYKRGRR